jgi:hypothetical protein
VPKTALGKIDLRWITLRLPGSVSAHELAVGVGVGGVDLEAEWRANRTELPTVRWYDEGGVVMAEIAIRNVRDLGESARRALEALLGRQLAEEEQVGVTALGARPAPLGDVRRIAAERLSESLKEMSDRAKSIPNDEFDSLVDEAMNDVRRRRC